MEIPPLSKILRAGVASKHLLLSAYFASCDKPAANTRCAVSGIEVEEVSAVGAGDSFIGWIAFSMALLSAPCHYELSQLLYAKKRGPINITANYTKKMVRDNNLLN